MEGLDELISQWAEEDENPDAYTCMFVAACIASEGTKNLELVNNELKELSEISDNNRKKLYDLFGYPDSKVTGEIEITEITPKRLDNTIWPVPREYDL